ncbi:hypothetical protein [Bradyrhizobium sp. Ai1a-2]|uniref:hypothetical protein n=1 Tax=Bradyrhizobium sp. Ai1a-2 TaxID=196490 RepID=UPI000427D62E|nr:hypothetical protein [Bradyrhizobium sp. Ai1a-2]
MSPDQERAYVEGSRAAWRKMLLEALTNLGGEERDNHDWLIERGKAIAALRRICAEHGDNDWPDDLSLVDIIEKHLARHLSD